MHNKDVHDSYILNFPLISRKKINKKKIISRDYIITNVTTHNYTLTYKLVPEFQQQCIFDQSAASSRVRIPSNVTLADKSHRVYLPELAFDILVVQAIMLWSLIDTAIEERKSVLRICLIL